MTPLAVLAVLAVAATPAAAQSHRHEDMPYAGLEERAIKALSAEDVAGLLAGDGMGFALAAELNGLPGPKHVLELESELDLTPAQREAVAAIHAEMQADAAELGAALVEAERHLDMMFAQRHATEELVRARTAEVAEIRGRLRAVHLVAHLATEAALRPEQVATYSTLRGYTPAG